MILNCFRLILCKFVNKDLLSCCNFLIPSFRITGQSESKTKIVLAFFSHLKEMHVAWEEFIYKRMRSMP